MTTTQPKTTPLAGLPPERTAKRILNLLILGIIVAMHVYGWHVTQIDLQKLASPPSNLRTLVADFLRPDVLARERKSERVYVPFIVPCGSDIQPQGAIGRGLTLTPACGQTGDEVRIVLDGARPDTAGRLNWRFPQGGSELLRRIKTDSNGHFEALVEVPPAPLGQETGQQGAEVVLEWEEGPLQFSETARAVGERMVETIFLALMATTLGVLLAFPLSFLAARNIMAINPIGSTVYYIIRLILNILRSVETLIWALIFIVWVGIGPFAGVLALTLHSTAALGKLYSEAVEAIDPGPVEAVRATGAGRLQTVLFAVIPQIVPQFIAFTIYRWDINVRMSTVIGLVGGGGIGFLLTQWINLVQYRQAATAVYAIVIVVASMDYFSGWLRAKIT
jgi:phosphonate transport system permease protein